MQRIICRFPPTSISRSLLIQLTTIFAHYLLTPTPVLSPFAVHPLRKDDIERKLPAPPFLPHSGPESTPRPQEAKPQTPLSRWNKELWATFDHTYVQAARLLLAIIAIRSRRTEAETDRFSNTYASFLIQLSRHLSGTAHYALISISIQ